MDWMDYRKKLGIGFNNEKTFDMLKNRLLLFIERIDERWYGNSSYLCYLSVVCERVSDYAGIYYSLQESLEASSSMPELIYKFVALYNTYLPTDSKYNEKFKVAILKWLKEGLNFLHIQYELFEDETGIFVFPKGAKELDNALVSQPLEWLIQYPKTHKVFCIALRQYSEGHYVRDIADNLRKALEEFLREFLKNDCDLNKNKKEVEAYLKSEHADPQLIQMFGSLMTHYYLLNNEIAKHNDKTDARYLEFLLYQTGLFIRMLIVIKQSHQGVSADAD